MRKIEIVQGILDANEATAEGNRAIFDSHRCLAVNIMASPGAGKTSFVLRTIEGLGPETRTAVIEGDMVSTVDAEKVQHAASAVVQINTKGMPESCALVADMVHVALQRLPMDQIDVVLIENVGNLLCPAEFNLGEHLRVVVASTPEGDDKPLKYPLIFADADAVVINKSDLLPYVDFDLDRFTQAVRNLNARAPFFPLSCKTGEGVSEWVAWLRNQRLKA
jgi:hydrogenase nickel incorporation protein HypB